ncbi:hypothetical protein WAI453_004045 [Rhynchosporium graminicola]|uniref:Uncharacterized protein n=1 Tax=Rhynchosporium graminicola TaxID=2792576 RepID=A0A1E1JYF1_9HELO|nr:uncharacterized protein RCO7_06788 [Rhynchosporium commune]
MNWVMVHLPRSVHVWLAAKLGMTVTEALYEDMQAVDSCVVGKVVMHELVEFVRVEDRNWRDLSEGVRARTCLVAGGLDDDENDSWERGEQLKIGNSESEAFKVERRHAWNIQDPGLFVSGIRSWMQRCAMPDEYVNLEKKRV